MQTKNTRIVGTKWQIQWYEHQTNYCLNKLKKFHSPKKIKNKNKNLKKQTKEKNNNKLVIKKRKRKRKIN